MAWATLVVSCVYAWFSHADFREIGYDYFLGSDRLASVRPSGNEGRTPKVSRPFLSRFFFFQRSMWRTQSNTNYKERAGLLLYKERAVSLRVIHWGCWNVELRGDTFLLGEESRWLLVHDFGWHTLFYTLQIHVAQQASPCFAWRHTTNNAFLSWAMTMFLIDCTIMTCMLNKSGGDNIRPVIFLCKQRKIIY